MNNARQSIHGSPNKSGEWRIGEERYAITSWGSRLDGGGHMNSARQSIHGSPNKS